MQMDDDKLLKLFQRNKFEEATRLNSQDTSMPEPDKVIEWALLEIVLQLRHINSQLSLLKR